MTTDNRINTLNIGLMLLSCIAAFVMPFEVFLFAYAFMGPLHYLTEISWLHDRNYYTKGKYDFIVLLVICILISYEYLGAKYHLWPYDTEANLEITRGWNLGGKLLFLALTGSVVMAFVKNLYVKIVSLFLLFLVSNQTFTPSEEADSNLVYIITAFVPTLIHVYVFTGLFMLFGALKARSRSGLWSFVVFLICPVLLIMLFRDQSFIHVSNYGLQAYGNPGSSSGFFSLNQSILYRFFDVKPDLSTAATQAQAQTLYNNEWIRYVFHSQAGILLMRFIAFAYTYHYLNWFSKTEIIRWHKVPKARFIVVVLLWIASVAIYAVDYTMGLQWLFFLSFSHVLLEFPLNAVSFVGIFRELNVIRKNGFSN